MAEFRIRGGQADPRSAEVKIRGGQADLYLGEASTQSHKRQHCRRIACLLGQRSYIFDMAQGLLS